MKVQGTNNSIKYDLKTQFDLLQVPKLPGVYCFLSNDNEHLYIGKAKILRNRIASYLRNSVKHPDKTALMLKKARFLDIFITKNEKEALILEAQLIGELKPKYNIRLRDDKAYPFLRIGIKNPYPRISLVRKRGGDSALYFGPFTSSSSLRKTISILTTVFKLRTCSDFSMKNRARPCLKYQIKRCSAPCVGNISQEEYFQDVLRACDFLKGRTSHVLFSLKKEMEEAAQNLEFEKAAICRDKIKAIEDLRESQTIVSKSGFDFDVIYIISNSNKGLAYAAVLNVREGILRSKEVIGVEFYEKTMLYSQFLKLYYQNIIPPKEIVVPVELPDQKEICEFLKIISKREVKLTLPKRGSKKRLLETAKLNASQYLDKEETQKANWHRTAQLLKATFKLKKMPVRVEGIDISNTSGLESVGSLVCFIEGKAFKEGYRHYNLKTKGPDDYSMIYEVMKRRLRSRQPPDLFIIDGGKGQLSAAIKAAKELGVFDSLDIISIAKEKKDIEGDRIYLPFQKAPLMLDRSSDELRFCQMVRDEAHGFGIRFHRKKRAKHSLSTKLLEINGLGPKRVQSLLRHFGSVEAIKKASVKELQSVPRLPETIAKAIYDFFHNQ